MAISSMTGFGRAEGASGGWSWAVEARSVNGRNLEVRFRGPPGFDSLERIAREGAQSRFQRGQLTIGLQAKRAESAAQVRINTDQIERYLAAVAGLVAEGRATPPSAAGLLALRGVIEADDTAQDPDAQARLEAAMGASLGLALDGVALLLVLRQQMDRIAELTVQAREIAAGQPEAIKARFEARMKELAGEAVSEDRIVQEAAAMAVKADVREELDRLAGHVEGARAMLGSDGGVGRRLDFLTQEFMREANTLCSKSSLTGLTAVGLDLKATIEQFREQVQNVE
jgi:uncharacterized protein (TIGR00255 family)